MTKRSTLLLAALFAATLGAAASPAHAWGRTGHKAVCLLAYEMLSDAARAKVDALMALDPEFENFTDACSWADTPRKRAREHYMNVGRATRPGEIASCGAAKSCVLSAIEKDYRILTDKSATAEERLEALKFLSHWVGDIHQPMHVSFSDDRGANDIETSGACRGTLHGTWDGCIIERARGDDAAKIADAVRDDAMNVSKQPLSAPRTWARESYAIAIAPATGYCTKTNRTCAYSETQATYEKGAAKRVMEIDRAYIDENENIVLDRVALAGGRLGALINAALGQ